MEQTLLSEAVKALDIVVSGRTFRTSTSTTFEQDIEIMRILEESGLEDLAKSYDPLKNDISSLSRKVIITAYGSGKLFHLLGAVMEEVGKPWTRESALANGEFFAKLKSSEDKESLKSSLVAVILGFFVSGLLSSKTSKISSLINLEMQPGSTEQSDEQLSFNEAISTLEAGTLSSVS